MSDELDLDDLSTYATEANSELAEVLRIIDSPEDYVDEAGLVDDLEEHMSRLETQVNQIHEVLDDE